MRTVLPYRKSVLVPCLACGIWVSSLAGTWAAVIDPFAAAHGFNIVVRNDFTINGGHTEGAVAAGGNLKFQGGTEISQKYAGSYKATGETIGAGLVVGGKVDFSGSSGQLTVGNNSAVKIGGGSYTVHDSNPGETVINNSANVNTYPRIQTRVDQTAASVGASSGYNFGAAATAFKQASQEMSSLTPTLTGAGLGLTHANVTLNNFGLGSGLNVFDLTGSELSYLQNINWNSSLLPSASRTLIFNVDLTGYLTYTLGTFAMGLDETYAPYVLFNFYGYSGTLNLNGGNQIVGSILAADASIVKGSSDPKGQSYSKTYVFNSGESHYYDNQVTYSVTQTADSSSVPDGSVFWVGAATLLGLLAWHRYATVRKWTAVQYCHEFQIHPQALSLSGREPGRWGRDSLGRRVRES